MDETLFHKVGANVIGQHHQMRLDTMVSSDARIKAVVWLIGMSMLVSFSLEQNWKTRSPMPGRGRHLSTERAAQPSAQRCASPTST